ncbi:uncharacterized protein TNCV_256501 [Trichonephila clavipes]|nr:uncharacterized protein TNCV_256501 [Trichonephila clavipes]
MDGSDVVKSGRPIFDDFFQHLWPYIGNNTENVVFQNVQAFVAYPHRPMTLHIPTENSLAVLNHKILEANSQVQKREIGGHQTCLSINRLWHELCDMLRRLVGTTAHGHHDCSIQGMKKVSNHGSIPITIDCNVVAFIVFEEVRTNIPPAHKAHQTFSFSGCNGVSTYTCGLASLQMPQFLFVDVVIQPKCTFHR